MILSLPITEVMQRDAQAISFEFNLCIAGIGSDSDCSRYSFHGSVHWDNSMAVPMRQMDNVASRIISITRYIAGIGSESNGSGCLSQGSGHRNDHTALPN